MAAPIAYAPPARDPRAELLAKVENAPAQHAEALLAGYELLQTLHDSGTLDLLRAALGSRDKVLDIAVQTAESPGSVRALRNLLLLNTMLARIDPEVLQSFTRAMPDALHAMAQKPQRPGLWALIKDFLWNRNFRRGLSAVNTLLETLGASLSRAGQPEKAPADPRRS